jgi:hypothetical protein
MVSSVLTSSEVPAGISLRSPATLVTGGATVAVGGLRSAQPDCASAHTSAMEIEKLRISGPLMKLDRLKD